MPYSDEIRAYLDQVSGQIRWKRARPVVIKELESHIDDQMEVYLAAGASEAEAAQWAVREMGDPVVTGAGLDRVNRPAPAWSMLVLVWGAVILGLVLQGMVAQNGSGVYTPKLWLTVLVAGICFFLAYFGDFSLLRRLGIPQFCLLCIGIYGAFLLGNMLVWRGQINGVMYSGSVLACLLLLCPVAYVGLLMNLRGSGYVGVLLAVGGIALPVVIAAAIPSLTAVLILLLTMYPALFTAIGKNWFGGRRSTCLLIAVGTFVLVLSSLLFMSRTRIYTAIFPRHDPEGRGYMGMQIRQALSGATLIGQGREGVGLGSWEEDGILMLLQVTLGFGWVALLLLLGIIGLVLLRGVQLALRQESALGRMTALMILGLYGAQVLVYLLMNLGICLFSPLPLPLMGPGKVSLMVNMGLMGLLMSIFRSGKLVKDDCYTCTKWPISQPGRGRVEVTDGKLIIHLHGR